MTDQEPAPNPPEPEDRIVETEHVMKIDGKDVRYTVTTGTIVLREEMERPKGEGESEGEKPRARVFFVAYTRKGVDDPGKRPVTFSFNGGPGSSSVWLHLGLLGPRRVSMGEIGELPPPPYRTIDNPYTLLDETDLVFIDPVTTGYSRPVEGEKAKEFHTVKRDIESVGDFIRLYTTRYRRWSIAQVPDRRELRHHARRRPRGLPAGPPRHVPERHRADLGRAQLPDASTSASGNDLPYVLFLPSYTATAWYHGLLAPELQADLRATLREAEVFALGEYATALLQGSALPPSRPRARRRGARALHRALAGVRRAGRPAHPRRALLQGAAPRASGKTVGRLDSRFTGLDRDTAGEEIEYDPSFTNIIGPYTAAFNDYVRRDLRYESDLPYEIISLKVNEQWTFPERREPVPVGGGDAAQRDDRQSVPASVFVANGYYDLGTPYFATEYTVHHLGLHPSLAREHRDGLLRGRAHDVHARAVPRAAADRPDAFLRRRDAGLRSGFTTPQPGRARVVTPTRRRVAYGALEA